jgi:hypothetical protein
VFSQTDRPILSSISIVKNGTFRTNPVSEMMEAFLFRGDENPIVLTREYDLFFSCDFDLVMFPFDTQYCYIEVSHSE